MSLISGLAIYFVIWWMTLFLTLPWGATSSHEAGQEVDKGIVKAAPMKPRMLLKFFITTILAGVFFGIVYYVNTSGIITLDDIPFFPRFENAHS